MHQETKGNQTMRQSKHMRRLRFKTTYLEYYKHILSKVCFCKNLFSKEYQKAKKLVNQKELSLLNQWIRQNNLVNF